MGLDLAVGLAGDHGVSHMKRAALHEDGGHRTTAHVQLSFDDDPGSLSLRVCLQFHDLGDKQDHVH